MLNRILPLLAAGCLLAALPTPVDAATPDDPPLPVSRPVLIHGGPVDAGAKAAVDTALLIGPWGSDAPLNGQFETPGGAPAWNDWTSVDLTAPTVNHWHVSDFAFDDSGAYAPLSGMRSAWCGDATLPSCDVDDPVGGYGDGWKDALEFRGAVADPGADCNLAIGALLSVDTEAGYDFVTLEAEKSAGFVEIASWDGLHAATDVNEAVAYLPGEYVGPGADEVAVVFRFVSDTGWSDADCSYPTAGAAIVDDLLVTSDNGVGTGGVVDFEDGSLGSLTTPLAPGVGDFAQVWNGLDDIDPCVTNSTPQVAFIDDGIVVPGTGGTDCVSWCYGPGGKVVNTTGGLIGPEAHLHNAVVSPPLAWPGADHPSARLAFTAYSHAPFDNTGAPGVFYTWHVRSSVDPDPAALEQAPWLGDNFVYLNDSGPPATYREHDHDVGAHIPADASWVQVRLAAYELGWAWFVDGDDGTPSPYFDNVRLQAVPAGGPSLSARTVDLTQDAFPERGDLDPADPGSHHVRFDAAWNLANPSAGEDRIDPGDSLIVAVVPLGDGATLVGMPRLHYRLHRNPVFDAYRTAGLPDAGAVDGWPTVDHPRFAFDLPDTGFLFPGDILHYYFAATEEEDGTQRTAILPADTTGFGDFLRVDAYAHGFTLRALPGVRDASLTHPPVLVWDDGDDTLERTAWVGALSRLGLAPGVDYDLFTTRSPASDQRNGLGGRATADLLAGYTELLYTSGDQTVSTLGDRISQSGGGAVDVAVLTAWLNQGGKDLFVCGDHLANDLAGDSVETADFLHAWLGLDAVDVDATPLLGGQTHPTVAPLAGNPVLTTLDSWRTVSACRTERPFPLSSFADSRRRTYDAVTVRDSAAALAEFLDPSGAPGAYPYSAATLNDRSDVGARIVSLPHALAALWTDPDEGSKAVATLAARERVLRDVLGFFGGPTGGFPSSAALPRALTARSHPNPFNPTTVIAYDLPRSGRVSVRVFDLRGRRVRTLVDGPRPAGAGEATWDGRDAAGARVASGVYFYEVRAGGDVVLGKMTLLK